MYLLETQILRVCTVINYGTLEETPDTYRPVYNKTHSHEQY